MKWMGFALGLALAPGPVAAQTTTSAPIVLTSQRVLELARTTSPDVLRTEAVIKGARGRLGAARAILPANPSAEILATSDRNFDRRPSYGVTVPFELGLRRAKRIGVARAELERDERRVLDARRLVSGAALVAYYEALHAERRLAIAKDRRALAEELSAIASERHRTGDAARLDVNLAGVERARAESEALAAESDIARRRADLAAVLGLPSGSAIVLEGDLADRSLLPDPAPVAAEAERSDVLAAESELRAARAAGSLARLWILPDLAFRVDYDREDGGSVLRRGLNFTVPIADFGQAERGEAAAREALAGIELATRRASASAEVAGAITAYAKALAAVERLEASGLASASETQSMAQESYRAGKINLAALIVVRHEAIEARREHADRLLEAAVAGIDLAIARETLR